MTAIEWFFKEYVFGFMYHDIDTAICGKANFLAALGLLEYTEFFGGLVIGELGKPNKRNRYKPLKDRFNAFFNDKYLGLEYGKLKCQLDIYDVFRCGLAHEYFAKGSSPIIMHNRPPQPCGIMKINGRWVFIVEKYYEDFKAGVGKYYEQLTVEKDQTLVDNFSKVIHIQADASGDYSLS
ncbi:MAG: hypothetical protein ACE5LA_05105 [Dehalococcoidales bacterium]